MKSSLSTFLYSLAHDAAVDSWTLLHQIVTAMFVKALLSGLM
jgi:hypothetical protein